MESEIWDFVAVFLCVCVLMFGVATSGDFIGT